MQVLVGSVIFSIVIGTHLCSGSAYAEAYSVGAASLTYEIRENFDQNPNSINVFEKMLSQNQEAGVGGIYLLSYDVLRSGPYQAVILNNSLISHYKQEFGVLIEVTPQLLNDANIERTIDVNEDRLKSLVGYTPAERNNIVDVLLASYKDIFGVYPTVASSRIIDSASAQYLKDNYGIRYQYIDQEDKDIDGGPPQYPYPASRNWLLIPDYTNQDPIWVIRKQTIDPMYGYGNAMTKSTYAKEDTNLLENALIRQTAGQMGFAAISFRDSDPSDLERNKKVSNYLVANKIHTLHLPDLPDLFSDPVSVYSRTQGDRAAWMITTPQYRYRIISDKETVKVTDIRVYDPSLTDPYNERAAQDGLHWIVPFLINSSRWYKNKSPKNDIFLDAKNDFGNDVMSLKMPDRTTDDSTKISTIKSQGSVSIQYFNLTGREVLAVFAEKNLSMIGFESNEKKLGYTQYAPSWFPVNENHNNLSWKWKEKSIYSMGISCRSIRCDMDFHTDNISNFNLSRFEHYPFSFPEKIGKVVDEYKSSISPNLYLIQGEEARSQISIRDSFGFPIPKSAITNPKNLLETIFSKKVGVESYRIEYENNLGNMTVDGHIITLPNCAKEWPKCFSRPAHLFSYLFPFMGLYLLR